MIISKPSTYHKFFLLWQLGVNWGFLTWGNNLAVWKIGEKQNRGTSAISVISANPKVPKIWLKFCDLQIRDFCGGMVTLDKFRFDIAT